MKEQFLSKWSNWWSLTRDAKQLNEAFARELNELIERELALRQPLVSGQLLSFFMWFRANGELHIDKSIEAMIELYLKESNLR